MKVYRWKLNMVSDRENSVVTQVNFSIRKNPHIVQYTCFFITKLINTASCYYIPVATAKLESQLIATCTNNMY